MTHAHTPTLSTLATPFVVAGIAVALLCLPLLRRTLALMPRARAARDNVARSLRPHLDAEQLAKPLALHVSPKGRVRLVELAGGAPVRLDHRQATLLSSLMQDHFWSAEMGEAGRMLRALGFQMSL